MALALTSSDSLIMNHRPATARSLQWMASGKQKPTGSSEMGCLSTSMPLKASFNLLVPRPLFMDRMQSLMHCLTITGTGVRRARCWCPQRAEK